MKRKKEKKDWRQLEDKFWFRKFFVKHHKKTKQDMPDTLTLCYWGQTLIKSMARWFFLERIVWILSPFFFVWLGALAFCIFGSNTPDSVFGELILFFVALIVGSGVVILTMIACLRQGEGKARLGDWIVLGLWGFVILGMLFLIVYSIVTQGVGEVDTKELLSGLKFVGIFIVALIVIGIIIGLALRLILKSHTWQRLVKFLKTVKKEYLCPIIFYPVGFKPIKFESTQK